MQRKSVLVDSVRLAALFFVFLFGASLAEAEQKSHRGFHVMATDDKGIETDLQNTVFYYEEKISDTSFIPHELTGIPVKRGAAAVHVKFDQIKEIEFKTGSEQGLPLFIILTNGKTGEFQLAIMGSFKGTSDFGEVQVPASGIKKDVFH